MMVRFSFFRRLVLANDQISMMSAILLLFFITADQSYQIQERRFMISEIEMTALVTGLHTGLYKVDERVLNAMARIPRTEFVETRHAYYAYKNVALPMVDERYILPEPFLTAMMIHLMGVTRNDKVLEIGYGTGYEAAVLSKLASHVYSLQQQSPLGNTSAHANGLNLDEYRNVSFKAGDGIFGWSESGPYDAILVKQAVPELPPALVNQLKPYGRLVVPVRDEFGEQRVLVILKMPDGRLEIRHTLYVKMTDLIPGQDL